MLSMIAAVDLMGGIGKDNKLPWKISEDLQYFKNTTINKVIIMGRNTYQSIGRPLPQRLNIVLSHNKYLTDNLRPGLNVLDPSKTDPLTYFTAPDEKIIIGGASIYKMYENKCDRVYLTVIHSKFDCDTFLDLSFLTNFYVDNVVDQTDKENPLKYQFLTLHRNKTADHQIRINQPADLFSF